MTAQLYRMYHGEKAEDTYVFSVVASNTDARYVVPTRDEELNSVFNQERINELIMRADEENIPKDPDGWALVATYNAGFNMNLQRIEGAESENMESLIEDEQEYADANAEKYAYLKENR